MCAQRYLLVHSIHRYTCSAPALQRFPRYFLIESSCSSNIRWCRVQSTVRYVAVLHMKMKYLSYVWSDSIFQFSECNIFMYIDERPRIQTYCTIFVVQAKKSRFNMLISTLKFPIHNLLAHSTAMLWNICCAHKFVEYSTEIFTWKKIQRESTV